MFRKTLALMLALSLVAFVVGCSDDESPTGPGDEGTTSKVTTVDNGDGTSTTVVDAGYLDAVEWVYFSLSTGDEVVIGDKLEAGDWDLAFKFAGIALNGGVSGTADVEVALLDGEDFATLAQAPASGYITDTVDDIAFDVDGGWYDYNPQTHAMSMNGRVYVVNCESGYYKITVDHFVDDAGTPGYPEFRWGLVTAP